MGLPGSALVEVINRILGRLRFPQLFLLTAGLFLLDLLIPDLIPFVDEILLGLATLLLGSWTDRRERRDRGPAPPAEERSGRAEPERGPIIDVTPERDER